MERLATSIAEFDLILDGGLPTGSLVVLAGGPGTGKTILAQQICFATGTPEHKAFYYSTLAEPSSKLVRHLQPFDFFDASALEERVEFLQLEGLLEESGDGVRRVMTEVVRAAFEAEPVVIVIDSAKALRGFADEKTLRKATYELMGRVAHTGAVLLLVGEYTMDEIEGSPEFSLADGIVQLAFSPHEPLDRRWLRVVKLRGAEHLAGKHSFRIGRTGIEVFPRLETIAPKAPVAAEGRISSGIPGLDEMMGGGIPAGDTTAVLGPSGSGKTILALRFIVQGLQEGERCLYVSFQENTHQLAHKAASFGWDLPSALESGQLTIYHVPQGELNLDAVGAVVRAKLATGSVRRVAVDSLAELVYAARESERFPAYARTLDGFIRAGGASSMITSEMTTLGPLAEPLGDLAFLFNNVVLLRYIEMESRLGRALTVVKMRDSDHSKSVSQFEIDDQGFTVQGELKDLTGILGWTALRRGEPPSRST